MEGAHRGVWVVGVFVGLVGWGAHRGVSGMRMSAERGACIGACGVVGVRLGRVGWGRAGAGCRPGLWALPVSLLGEGRLYGF